MVIVKRSRSSVSPQQDEMKYDLVRSPKNGGRSPSGGKIADTSKSFDITVRITPQGYEIPDPWLLYTQLQHHVRKFLDKNALSYATVQGVPCYTYAIIGSMVQNPGTGKEVRTSAEDYAPSTPARRMVRRPA